MFFRCDFLFMFFGLFGGGQSAIIALPFFLLLFVCLFSLWKVIAMTGLLLLADAVDRRVAKAESGRCVACHAGAIRTSNLR